MAPQTGPGPIGRPIGPTHVAQPSVPPLSFQQKLQLCLGYLRDQFAAYQRGGGKETFRAWLQSEIVQALTAEGRPYTLAPSSPQGRTMRRDAAPSQPQGPPPPSEPGLVNEGLGPIGWALWGYGWAKEGLGQVVGEISVEGVIDWVEDTFSSSGGDPNQGAGDGAQGDSPGDGSGLDTPTPPDPSPEPTGPQTQTQPDDPPPDGGGGGGGASKKKPDDTGPTQQAD
jgi:hypothetical protein